MRKIYALLLVIATTIFPQEIELSVTSVQQTCMPLVIIVLDERNDELKTIAEIIKKDLQFTEQFQPYIKKYSEQLSKKKLRSTIHQFCISGTPLALCLSSKAPGNIEWRLYETMECSMIAGKQHKKLNNTIRGVAHAITDEIWKTLTGNDGFFSAPLAYCKNSKNETGHTLRKIYISDFDGSHEQLLVDLPTISIAPRWDITKPRIFYSEYTDTNVPLMSISMKKKRKTVSNFDGINMLASISPDGNIFAYCSSRASGSCQIYLQKNGILKRCTHNSGNNTSPIFIDNQHLCFCSDFQAGNPQIYIANLQNGHLQRITKGGYCTSPSYCPKTNKIVYHMMIHGTMQIMVYDCATKTHTQLTKTAGNKHEASWSPCGTQILFCCENHDNTSRLAILNLLTDKTKYLTNSQDHYSYPNWGPRYQTFPVIV